MARKRTTTVKVGRDAKTGRFITVSEAKQKKKTAIIETINRKGKTK